MAAEAPGGLPAAAEVAAVASFEETGLEPRLLRGLGRMGFERPTAVQARAIPRLLEGGDAIVAARTGTGKTLAYLAPALHAVLTSCGGDAAQAARGWQALILVPTRELCDQVARVAGDLASAARVPVRATSLSPDADARRAGAIVVATPSRARAALSKADEAANRVAAGAASGPGAATGGASTGLPLLPSAALLQGIRLVIMDEADLLLEYGHGEDLDDLAGRVPRGAQRCLVSATASPALAGLARAALRDPVMLDLRAADDPERASGAGASGSGEAGEGAADGADDPAAAGVTASVGPDGTGLTTSNGSAPTITMPGPVPFPGVPRSVAHWRVDLPAARVKGGAGAGTERLLHLLALLRLGVLKPKVLVFVSSASAAVRTRLFLAGFGIKAAAVHSELPHNSRAHALEAFNRGLVDCLIAADVARKRRDGADEEGLPAGPGAEDDEESDDEPERAAAADAAGADEGADAEAGKDRYAHLPAEEAKKARRKDAKRRAREAKRKAGATQRTLARNRAPRGASRADAAEFGVTRGVDFRDVRAVVNLEAPESLEDYTHRAGRTGRAGAAGAVVTILSPDGEDAAFLRDAPSGASAALRPLAQLLKPSAVDALRYRAEDVARGLTRAAVREARAADLAAELVNSRALEEHFGRNPADLAMLRHDLAPRSAQQLAKEAPRLGHLPGYLRAATGGAPENLPSSGRRSSAQRPRRTVGRSRGGGGDPLKAQGAFAKSSSKRGTDAATEMELRAEEKGKQESRRRARKGVQGDFAPKHNVRKKRKR